MPKLNDSNGLSVCLIDRGENCSLPFFQSRLRSRKIICLNCFSVLKDHPRCSKWKVNFCRKFFWWPPSKKDLLEIFEKSANDSSYAEIAKLMELSNQKVKPFWHFWDHSQEAKRRKTFQNSWRFSGRSRGSVSVLGPCCGFQRRILGGCQIDMNVLVKDISIKNLIRNVKSKIFYFISYKNGPSDFS